MLEVDFERFIIRSNRIRGRLADEPPVLVTKKAFL